MSTKGNGKGGFSKWGKRKFFKSPNYIIQITISRELQKKIDDKLRELEEPPTYSQLGRRLLSEWTDLQKSNNIPKEI